MIDSRAIIDSSARLAEGVSVGPWSIIGPGVEVGEGTQIASHVVIKSNTRIGSNNRIYQFASVGEDPADKKFEGEETWLEIGSDNIIREGCTLHRGTGFGGGYTRIGNSNLLMPYVHVAHDCIVGNNTIFANNVGISGHVEVGDWAILGGYAGINQFLKIGAHAMIGGMTHVSNDVPAFIIVSGTPPEARSINAIGLERRGFDKDTIQLIRRAFKILYKKGLLLQEAIEQLEPLARENDQIQLFLDSILSSTRGIQR
ncbi:MAG: acyl-ACP--UDP-N-acetylglucosamine O-acyltransferase [Gammaproteobacteria bacterium]|nr:acyl-ACP--UDP-N-acetylglucosamine O-acyltransferase [Gammaproteobacteria bacterium]